MEEKLGRQPVYAALIARFYGQYDVKFYILYFVDSGILCSYQGNSYRSFFLRWDPLLSRIRESVDVDAVLAFNDLECHLYPYEEIDKLELRPIKGKRNGRFKVTMKNGEKSRLILGHENRTKNEPFSHIIDDTEWMNRLHDLVFTKEKRMPLYREVLETVDTEAV